MIGQGLLESGWLEPVPNTRDGGAVFKDEYVLYQPGAVRNHCVIANGSQKPRLRQIIVLQDTAKMQFCKNRVQLLLSSWPLKQKKKKALNGNK